MSNSIFLAFFCSLGLLPCQYAQNAAIGAISSYVLDYAPIVYLHSTETYFPASISSQLNNTTPKINFTAVADVSERSPVLNLNDLSRLNRGDQGSNVYLSSTEDPTELPSWLSGSKPDSSGHVAGSPSSAFITRDLGNGTLYAFYMFFYPFNQGLLNIGNHVGDWEHFALRFDDGVPSQAYYSQHSGGTAYTYAALEKDGRRPIVYSANGTHANYATSGTHAVLNVAKDLTDRGLRWDPAAAAYLVQFSPNASQVAHGTYLSYAPGDSTAASGGKALAPTDWLYFLGKWGDDQLPKSDPGQAGSGAFIRWTVGPTGPQDKDLARTTICPSASGCKVLTSIQSPPST